MQCNLIYYNLRPPVQLSRKLWWNISLFTSENELVHFQSCVLTVFRDSTSYAVLIVFWMLLMEPVETLACWWHCACLKSVSGRPRLEKTWTFWDAYMTWLCAQKLFRHKWRKLAAAFFFFIVLMDIADSNILKSFFHLYFRFWMKFFRIAVSRKRLQLESKLNLTATGIFFIVFWWIMTGLVDLISAWTKVCLNCSMLILFWRNWFVWIVWGVFWSFL